MAHRGSDNNSPGSQTAASTISTPSSEESGNNPQRKRLSPRQNLEDINVEDPVGEELPGPEIGGPGEIIREQQVHQERDADGEDEERDFNVHEDEYEPRDGRGMHVEDPPRDGGDGGIPPQDPLGRGPGGYGGVDRGPGVHGVPRPNGAEGRNDERAPLVQHANEDVQCFSCLIYRRKWNTLRSSKLLFCTGALVLLLMAAVVAVSATGLGLMLKNEKGQTVRLFTTSNESNEIYSESSGIALMSSVCMEVDTDDDYITDWILFTSSCHKETNSRNYTRGHIIQEKRMYYYFYFVKESRIAVKLNGSGIAKYRFTKDASKVDGLREECFREGVGQDIPSEKMFLNNTGYYVVCIKSTTTAAVHFEMHITEVYYDMTERNMCNDTRSLKQKCCHFPFKENNAFSHDHCVYVSRDVSSSNEKPELLRDEDSLNSVDISIHYNDALKTLTIVAMFAVVVAMATVFITVYCLKIKVNGRQRVHR